MMLERIQIENFQAHEKLRIVFDPHITTIVGSSDTGKSAIIRAIAWVCRNSVDDKSFIRWGADAAKVSLWADGAVVRRTRSKSENTYTLDDKEYKAFGITIPPEIEDLLNIKQVNFQFQLDTPFWFTETAGQVSRNLNAIINLEIIDDAQGKLAGARGKARGVLEHTQQSLIAAREEYSQYKTVKAMEVDFAVLEKLHSELEEKQKQAQALGEAVVRAQGKQKTAAQWRKCSEAGAALVSLGTAATGLQQRQNALQGLIQRGQVSRIVLRETNGLPEAFEKLLSIKEKRDATGVLLEVLATKIKKATTLKAQAKTQPDITELCRLQEEAVAKRKISNTFTAMFQKAASARGELFKKGTEAEAAKAEFNIQVGDTCPICQSPLSQMT